MLIVNALNVLFDFCFDLIFSFSANLFYVVSSVFMSILLINIYYWIAFHLIGFFNNELLLFLIFKRITMRVGRCLKFYWMIQFEILIINIVQIEIYLILHCATANCVWDFCLFVYFSNLWFFDTLVIWFFDSLIIFLNFYFNCTYKTYSLLQHNIYKFKNKRIQIITNKN